MCPGILGSGFSAGPNEIRPPLLAYGGPVIFAPTVEVDAATIQPPLVNYGGPTIFAPTLTAIASGVDILNAVTLVSTTVTDPGSKTVSAGTDRELLYFASARNGVGETVASVSYGGQPMAEVQSAFGTGSGADVDGSVWRLDDAGIAAATDANFSITGLVAANNQYRAFALSLSGVDQTTPLVDSFSSIGSAGSTPPASALITVDGGFALAFTCNAAGGADAAWTNVVEAIEEAASISYQSIADAATDGTNLTPTMTPTAFTNSVLIGMSLRKA